MREEDVGFPLQVDHIISRKRGGLLTADNLACACVLCNRHKGTDVASIDVRTGRLVRLFDPRRDTWADHFRLDGPFIRLLSEVGAATVRLLRLNAVEWVAERRSFQRLGSYPAPETP